MQNESHHCCEYNQSQYPSDYMTRALSANDSGCPVFDQIHAPTDKLYITGDLQQMVITIIISGKHH